MVSLIYNFAAKEKLEIVKERGEALNFLELFLAARRRRKNRPS